MQQEDYLFEAATQDERDKFVFAFKVMVARLASKIIVGDKDVFDEFFTPLGVAKKKKSISERTFQINDCSKNVAYKNKSYHIHTQAKLI